MSKAKAFLTLTPYNMGEATESDYDAWVDYVSEHIDEACGFAVDVDACQFGRGQLFEDQIEVTGSADDVGACDERERIVTTVKEALASLWERWCAEGAPGAD